MSKTKTAKAFLRDAKSLRASELMKKHGESSRLVILDACMTNYDTGDLNLLFEGEDRSVNVLYFEGDLQSIS